MKNLRVAEHNKNMSQKVKNPTRHKFNNISCHCYIFLLNCEQVPEKNYVEVSILSLVIDNFFTYKTFMFLIYFLNN